MTIALDYPLFRHGEFSKVSKRSIDDRVIDQMATWLITGCSTGLGRSLAKATLNRGDNVVVTARNVEAVQDILAAHPNTAVGAALDVTNSGQVAAAVNPGTRRALCSQWASHYHIVRLGVCIKRH